MRRQAIGILAAAIFLAIGGPARADFELTLNPSSSAGRLTTFPVGGTPVFGLVGGGSVESFPFASPRRFVDAGLGFDLAAIPADQIVGQATLNTTVTSGSSSLTTFSILAVAFSSATNGFSLDDFSVLATNVGSFNVDLRQPLPSDSTIDVTSILQQFRGGPNRYVKFRFSTFTAGTTANFGANLTLRLQPVPEPSALALTAGGVLLIAGGAARSRARARRSSDAAGSAGWPRMPSASEVQYRTP